jgi:hypothetical protein
VATPRYEEVGMKKVLVFALMAALLACVIGLVGCGGESVTVKTDEGEVTVGEKDGGVSVETEEGETKLSTRMPTEDELGVPIYPDARMDENAQLAFKDTKVAVMWTEDVPDKVIAWYKDKLSGKPGYQELINTPTEAMLVTQAGDVIKMVTIGKNTVDHPGTTSIGIASQAAPQQ